MNDDVIESLNDARIKIFKQIREYSKKMQETRKQAQNYSTKRSSLIEDLKMIDRLLEKRNKIIHKGVDEKNFEETVLYPSEKLKPTDAIKWLFDNFSGKAWSPTELRDYLEQLKEKDKLDSDANNLLWIIHSTLRILRKDYVIREGNKYIKNTEFDEDELQR